MAILKSHSALGLQTPTSSRSEPGAGEGGVHDFCVYWNGVWGRKFAEETTSVLLPQGWCVETWLAKETSSPASQRPAPQFLLREPGRPGSYSWKNSERSPLSAPHLMPESLLQHVDTVFHILLDYAQEQEAHAFAKRPSYSSAGLISSIFFS